MIVWRTLYVLHNLKVLLLNNSKELWNCNHATKIMVEFMSRLQVYVGWDYILCFTSLQNLQNATTTCVLMCPRASSIRTCCTLKTVYKTLNVLALESLVDKTSSIINLLESAISFIEC